MWLKGRAAAELQERERGKVTVPGSPEEEATPGKLGGTEPDDLPEPSDLNGVCPPLGFLYSKPDHR